MSEQEQISQLSALFDGELPAQQAELVIRRALKDPSMRQRWQRYALIGACVRGEPLVAASAGRACLAERIAGRITEEAEILAPWNARAAASASSGGGLGRFLGRGAMGGAIAAAVAIMAVFVVRNVGPVAGPTSGNELFAQDQGLGGNAAAQEVAARVESTSAADSVPHSYTTPGENARAGTQLIEQPPLAHYVVAHSEQAASSLGFSYDLTEGTVLMTPDEIQAHLQ
jgi:negative regulator of sigma E activity